MFLEQKICIWEWFQKDYDWRLAIEQLLKIQLCILGINYFLRYIAIENTCFKLQTYLIILVFLLYFLTN